jgi:hypothetical protein
MPYSRRPTPIKPQTLRRSVGVTCFNYYVSVFVSAQDRQRSVFSKAGGIRLRLLDPWRDVSQVEMYSVRRAEHADRLCSSSLTAPYKCSISKAIHNEVTVMYYLFTLLVLLDVVLTQITDPQIPGSSHIPTGRLCHGIS